MLRLQNCRWYMRVIAVIMPEGKRLCGVSSIDLTSEFRIKQIC